MSTVVDEEDISIVTQCSFAVLKDCQQSAYESMLRISLSGRVLSFQQGRRKKSDKEMKNRRETNGFAENRSEQELNAVVQLLFW